MYKTKMLSPFILNTGNRYLLHSPSMCCKQAILELTKNRLHFINTLFPEC